MTLRKKGKTRSLIVGVSVVAGLFSPVAASPAIAQDCHGNNSYEERIYTGGAPGAQVTVYQSTAEMDNCQAKKFYDSLDDRATAENYIAGFASLAGHSGKAVSLMVLADSAETHFGDKKTVKECSADFTRPIRIESRGSHISNCVPQ